MATIIERRNPSGKTVYRVQYRIKGQKSLSQTFWTEKEAKQFITVMDAKLIQDKHNALLGVKATTFSEVIERYRDEVDYAKGKETQRTERPVLRYWQEQLSYMTFRSTTSQHISRCIK